MRKNALCLLFALLFLLSSCKAQPLKVGEPSPEFTAEVLTFRVEKRFRGDEKTEYFTEVTEYFYDESGVPEYAVVTQNGEEIYREYYRYDENGNLLEKRVRMSQNSKSHSVLYAYDAAGNCIRADYPNGLHDEWTYDKEGRVTEYCRYDATDPLPETVRTYAYEQTGLLSRTVSKNAQGQSVRTFSYQTDEEMRVTYREETVSEYENGAVLKARYTINPEGRISGLYSTKLNLDEYRETGRASLETDTLAFHYNHLGRLYAYALVENREREDICTTVEFLYGETEVAEEFSGLDLVEYDICKLSPRLREFLK